MLNTIINTKMNSYKILIFLIFSVSLFGIISCSSQKEEENIHSNGYTFPYKIDNPDFVYRLPESLSEISGISFYKKNKIACIQDERAIIYIYDTKKEKISSKIDFGKNNDYEDIAITENTAYVLRSDGTVFKVVNIDNKKKTETIKIETPLSSKNNTEGLLFDKNSNSLLIACKSSPSINKKEKHKGFKAIYKLDLETNKLIKKPEYLINLSYIDSLSELSNLDKFVIEKSQKVKLFKYDYSFQPSGIAICPKNENNIYIISSIRKLLIVMNKEEEILDVIKLDGQIFNQPEGICFSKSGDLYISNEGKNGTGNIIKFNRIINLE